jgi:hypothetical protein
MCLLDQAGPKVVTLEKTQMGPLAFCYISRRWEARITLVSPEVPIAPHVLSFAGACDCRF